MDPVQPERTPETLVALNRAQGGSETDTFTEPRYRHLARYLPPDCRDLVDIGCGTGRGGRVLTRLRPILRITGVDCVPERLARLDAAVYPATVCGCVPPLGLPDTSCDAVVAAEFIEHVPDAVVDAALREFRRVLRPGGRLLLTTPNPGYLLNRFTGRSVLDDPAHCSAHAPADLARRLSAAGFAPIRIRGTGRVSRFLGERFPCLAVYGSYLAVAEVPAQP